MSDHVHCHDAASDGGSTGYSDFDDDTIQAVLRLASQCDPTQVAECSSSATPSSVTLGKRKSPEESEPFDGTSAAYKKRTISSGSLNFDSGPSSSLATLPDSSLPPTTTQPPEYDGPEPYIIVSPNFTYHASSLSHTERT